MDAPPIRYVTTDDGVSIAYWALGHGPPLVQLPTLPHTHIGLEWEFPEIRRGYELAAAERTIVRYDGRGTGLSQRDVKDFSLETMIADLDAVVGETGSDRVALLGLFYTCAVAVAYAARHPDRVSHLLLWCPVVDGSVNVNNPQLHAARRVLQTDWETYCEMMAYAALGWSETEAARRFAALIRASVQPDTATLMLSAMHKFNVWADLPRLNCPALVLHRPETPQASPETVQQMMALIPDAQLALFEGSSLAPFLGDWRAVIRAMSGFLGMTFSEPGMPGRRRALRLLSMKNDALTPRERQIVDLVVRGLTNRQIAEELFLAEKTVENHVGRILVKLDLRSRTQLAAYAVEHGLSGKSA